MQEGTRVRVQRMALAGGTGRECPPWAARRGGARAGAAPRRGPLPRCRGARLAGARRAHAASAAAAAAAALAVATALLAAVPPVSSASASAAWSAAPPGRPPDVILVVSDDHSALEVGAYARRAYGGGGGDAAEQGHGARQSRQRRRFAPARTPFLDSLAASGVVFLGASTPSTLCNPSRASLFSGLYPPQHGVHENHAVPRDGTRLISGMLRARGYHTALLGKDEVFGHETYLTTCGEADARRNVSAEDSLCDDVWPRVWPSDWMRTQRCDYFRGAAAVDFHERCRAPEGASGTDCKRQLEEAGTLGCDACVRDLRDEVMAAARYRDAFRPEAPMLLVVALNEPHEPYPDAAQSGIDNATVRLPEAYERVADDVYSRDAAASGGEGFDSAALIARERAVAAGYYTAVERVDALVAAVSEGWHEAVGEARANATLTLFTADHGAGRLITAKASMYNYGAQVPLIASWPDKLAPGSATDAVVDFTDVVPTLLELAGAAAVEVAQLGLDGISFARSVLAKCERDAPAEGACAGATHRSHAYGWWPSVRPLDTNIKQGCYPMRSVRTAEWKLIANLNGAKELVHLAYTGQGDSFPRRGLYRWYIQHMSRYVLRPLFELYHLPTDPHELDNVAEAHPEVVRELTAKLAAWMDAQGDVACLGDDCEGPDGATCCELSAAAAARSGAALCQLECPPECLTCAADGACEACAFRQCLRLVSSGEQFSVQGVRKAEGGTCARGRAEVLDMLMADAAAGACLPLDGGRTGEVSASARAGVHVASASALAMLAAAVGSVVTRRGC